MPSHLSKENLSKRAIERPKVSICIPAYNRPNSLKRLLDSIEKQDMDNYEIVITDDSETSDIYLTARSHTLWEKIRYIRNDIRLGSPANWNKAMLLAKGIYVKIMHHDDWFSSKNALSRLLDSIDSNANVDFAFCGFSYYYENEDKYSISDFEAFRQSLSDPLNLLCGNFIGTPSTTIFRNESVELFDEKLVWYVDIEFYIRMLKKNSRYVYVGESLVNCTSRSPKQVSARCISDARINIGELIYAYNKLKGGGGMSKAVEKRIVNELVRFGVESLEQLSDLSGTEVIPEEIKRKIRLVRLRSKIKKAFNNYARDRQ